MVSLGYLRKSISSRVFHQIVNFSSKIVAYQEWVCLVTLLVSFAQPRRRRKGENKKGRSFFGRFLCRHCMTNAVKVDWNGNAIVTLITKIVAASIWPISIVVATTISSEKPIQRLKGKAISNWTEYLWVISIRSVMQRCPLLVIRDVD